MNEQESLIAAINEEVKLHDYDPSWPGLFSIEEASLRTLLPGTFLDIQHVGSTAVPGMVAKPIIDILAGVGSMSIAESLADPLRSSGYTTSAEFNASLSDRKWFMRWKNGHRTHHLHVVVHKSQVWHEHLRFRDTLRASPELAAQYALLKRRLASELSADREAYTDAKAEFVRNISKAA